MAGAGILIADGNVVADITVERAAVGKYDIDIGGLNGVVNFTWVATQTGNGPISRDDRFKLPGAIQIPLGQYLGGFPLLIALAAPPGRRAKLTAVGRPP